MSFKFLFKHIILFLFLLINEGILYSQNSILKIEANIFIGNFNKADSIIELNQKNIANKDYALLYRYKGDINKLKGDIDAAYNDWIKSNKYRKKTYPKNDYHLAWNYALLSNYHYEKINSNLALNYADSCMSLLSGLTIDQQKEIAIYKIWNILAQSYKTSKRKLANDLYFQSEKFIVVNSIDEHYLAETYRLIGNSHLDMTYFSLENMNNDEASIYYKTATLYYYKSIEIWKNLYGSEHFELAKTYFVQGLLNYYVNNRLGENTRQLSILYFELAFKAYGVVLDKSKKTNIESIPNKEDFLMACKYLTLAYFRGGGEDSTVIWLEKADDVNQIAINTWQDIHLKFNGVNTNQNLAIYNLVPFSETISIQLYRKELGLEYSVSSIFEANQQLKYYDLLKYSSKNGNDMSLVVKIEEIQSKLKKDEIFLDYHVSEGPSCIVAVKITTNSSELIVLPIPKRPIFEQFQKAIERMDYDTYVNTAYKLYQTLIQPCQEKNNRLIICTDGLLTNIPFEALLSSKTNWNLKDYRKLDYLLVKNEIEYVLNPQLFRTFQPREMDFKMEVFIPNQKEYSYLPFSEQLGKQLNSDFHAKIHLNETATKRSFLEINSLIIHMSGHGVINNDDMLGSFLVLSDSMLFLNDLWQMKNLPSLMVLNTCNSANGKVYYGDGVDGFVRAISMLGTRSIISNLWEVDDEYSNMLLSKFYENLSNGVPLTEVLRLAKLEQIKNAPSSQLGAPYYWAGHRLIGEEAIFKYGNEPKRIWIYWFLIFALVITVAWLLRKRINS